MSLDRRKLFALGGLGALGAGTAAAGPEFDPHAWGIVVKLSLQPTEKGMQWCVLVPDDRYKWLGYGPPVVKWMLLSEFLSVVEQTE